MNIKIILILLLFQINIILSYTLNMLLNYNAIINRLFLKVFKI
jgi:hypothetical protein